MKVVSSVIVLALSFQITHTLRCYTCSIGEQDVDKGCIDDLTTITVTNCNKKYCTITRQEYKDPKDKVASMYRGCEDKPLHMNEIVEDESYRVYFTACQVDLCNGGSGKAADGGSQTGSLGDKSTLIVPGTGNAGSLSAIITFPFILILLITTCFI